jgi:hypothetical protein
MLTNPKFCLTNPYFKEVIELAQVEAAIAKPAAAALSFPKVFR